MRIEVSIRSVLWLGNVTTDRDTPRRYDVRERQMLSMDRDKGIYL